METHPHIGDRQRAVITPAYREMQAELHARYDSYGTASVGYAPLVSSIAQQLGVGEILDYGAGKGRLAQALSGISPRPLTVKPYDPAIEAWSAAPDPAEMVVCIDVLEHIEPPCLDAVLDDLKRVTLRFGFFSVHTGPAVKLLSDGRNAHLIQEPPSWWLPKIFHRFELAKFSREKSGFWVLVQASARS